MERSYNVSTLYYLYLLDDSYEVFQCVRFFSHGVSHCVICDAVYVRRLRFRSISFLMFEFFALTLLLIFNIRRCTEKKSEKASARNNLIFAFRKQKHLVLVFIWFQTRNISNNQASDRDVF